VSRGKPDIGLRVTNLHYTVVKIGVHLKLHVLYVYMYIYIIKQY